MHTCRPMTSTLACLCEGRKQQHGPDAAGIAGLLLLLDADAADAVN